MPVAPNPVSSLEPGSELPTVEYGLLWGWMRTVYSTSIKLKETFPPGEVLWIWAQMKGLVQTTLRDSQAS